MLIDIHTHLGRIVREDTVITAEDLISDMDKRGIDKSVVLPLDACKSRICKRGVI